MLLMSKLTFACIVFSLVSLTACRDERRDNASATQAPGAQTSTTAQQQPEFEAPLGPNPTREEIERQRFDSAWRRLRSFQAGGTPSGAAARPQGEAAQLKFLADPKFQEKLDGASFANIDAQPLRVPVKGDVSGPTVLRAQVMLDRARFTVGAIDGRWGKNSEIAVYWFQRESGLPPTGDIDEATFRALAQVAGGPTLINYTITPEDAKGPFTKIPEDVYDQEDLDCLCFENLGERIAEKFHVERDLLEALNPNVDFGQLDAGATLVVPNVRRGDDAQLPKFARVVISVRGSYFHGVDAAGRVLFHAPTTLGSEYDPSPTETLKIVETTFNPYFHYQPKLFHEVPDDEPEAHLKPGPNSPVGVVWIALSKKHYGIHGTSSPETIGYASSHGCVRLTNWDAHEVAHRAPEGILVAFVDTRGE